MKVSLPVIALLGFMPFTNVNASFVPYGVQTNIVESTVDTWGWSSCHTETKNTSASSTVTQIKANCVDDYTMMGLFNVSTNSYEVLAAANTSVVFAETPGVYRTFISDSTNQDNGVNWYLYDNPASVYGGWGFASVGTSVKPVHCDYQDQGNGAKNSLCIHMRDVDGFGDGNSSDDYISDAYAWFDDGALSSASDIDYQIRFLNLSDNTSGAVPEPSILALMGLGIFGLGLSRRKMKK